MVYLASLIKPALTFVGLTLLLSLSFFPLIVNAGEEGEQRAALNPVWSAPTGIDNNRDAQVWLKKQRRRWQERGCLPAANLQSIDTTEPSFLAKLNTGVGPEAPAIVFNRDPIAESMRVIYENERGCPVVQSAGRSHAFSNRAFPSIYANVELPALAASSPVWVLLQDKKSIRAWISHVPIAEFKELSNTTSGWLGFFITILMVLLVRAWSMVIAERSVLAGLYAFYVLTSLLYQFQALGIGPMWLATWPDTQSFEVMQAISVSLVILGIGLLIIGFLRPGAVIFWIIGGGLFCTCASFLASGWLPQLYKVGSVFILPLVVISVGALLFNLRSGDRALGWFAIGLTASLVGGAVQAASILSGGSGINALAIFAFPIGNLVEAVFWLVAIGVRLKEEQDRVIQLYVDNRDLASRLVEAEERQRQKMATELHDDLGQVITGLRLQLKAMRIVDKVSQEDLDTLDRMVELTHKSARSAMYELRPSIIDSDLESTLRSGDLDSLLSAAGVAFLLDIEIDGSSLNSVQRINIFRIIQETAHNCVRHAEAQRFSVRLAAEETSLRLEINDDGKGFDAHTLKPGMGLRNIRDRVTVLNADYEVETSQSGTRHHFVIPLPAQSDE